jgi:hypothetical protein
LDQDIESFLGALEWQDEIRKLVKGLAAEYKLKNATWYIKERRDRKDASVKANRALGLAE